jgi:hypothetical protein
VKLNDHGFRELISLRNAFVRVVAMANLTLPVRVGIQHLSDDCRRVDNLIIERPAANHVHTCSIVFSRT